MAPLVAGEDARAAWALAWRVERLCVCGLVRATVRRVLPLCVLPAAWFWWVVVSRLPCLGVARFPSVCALRVRSRSRSCPAPSCVF